MRPLGKTPQQLVWADNVVRKANKPTLILTPLAVSDQTIREANKFGIEAVRSRDGKFTGKRIIVTNYQQLHKFTPDDFAGVVCDESSCLKNADAVTRLAVTEFMRTVPYRLLCTATAAPNDYWELGTSSDALGALGFRDMITQFFKQETEKDYLGWGRTKYRFRGHAETPFWKWVCSWARVCRKPSDLGFNDGEFILPPLEEEEIRIDDSPPREGFLFSVPANTLEEQREELRVTLTQRCAKAAELMEQCETCVAWCHLNPEADAIERMVIGAKQVCGSMSDDEKEELLIAFQAGQLNRLVLKPVLGAWGLNWQHCHDVVCFPSHSWEQYYQLVRRCWRFGQKSRVRVRIITTEGQQGVMNSLKRKTMQADRMFTNLVKHTNDAMHIERTAYGNQRETLPAWLN